jgi:hypothetical protein
MVFKDEALRDVALASAEKGSEFSDVSAFSLSEEPQRIRSYRFFAFETFWRHLYSRRRSVWVHERLMMGAPTCLRMPYAPDQAPAFLRELVARDEQNLLNRELFEADRYPPLLNPSMTEELGALPLHKLSCTRDWLRDFCWKDISLISVEAMAMRRLELVLSTLCDVKTWSFSHPIYPAVGSPYIKAIRDICRGIHAAVERGDAACSWLMPAQRTDGPRTEEVVAHDREKGMTPALIEHTMARSTIDLLLGCIYFLIDLSLDGPVRKPTQAALDARRERSSKLIHQEVEKKGKSASSKKEHV